MNQSEFDHFLGRHPRLYHFAGPGSWAGIRRNGLLSTSALLDLYGVRGDERFRLESNRRDGTSTLSAPGLPDVRIRDQHAINKTNLERSLTGGLTSQQWHELLNRKVFFWANQGRLWRMSRWYEGGEVLVIDSDRLITAYRERVRLSHINSGATRFPHHYRGYNTFCRIEDYPYAQRGKKVAEVCVENGVPDIADYVKCVRKVRGDTWGATIYSREGASD